MGSIFVAIGISSIALAVAAWGIFDRWMDHREKRLELASTAEMDADRKVELLASENSQLIGKIDRLQERLGVLERIATEPARRTADEIEALREN